MDGSYINCAAIAYNVSSGFSLIFFCVLELWMISREMLQAEYAAHNTGDIGEVPRNPSGNGLPQALRVRALPVDTTAGEDGDQEEETHKIVYVTCKALARTSIGIEEV